jgi:hypothetical protein
VSVEFEDLPALWRSRKGPAGAGLSAALPEEIVERSRKLEAVVRRRDRLETAVALAIAPFFAAVVVLGTSAAGRLGALILALSCLFIPLRLAHARRLFRPAPRDLSLRAFLAAERERLLAQRRLLRSILWWYLLPLGIGVVLLFGSRSSALATGIYGVVVVALYAGIYRLNQRAVATELDPRLAEMDEMLRAVAEEPEA